MTGLTNGSHPSHDGASSNSLTGIGGAARDDGTPPITTSRQFWLSVRQALLGQVDAIEVLLGMRPRTAELRASQNAARRHGVESKQVAP